MYNLNVEFKNKINKYEAKLNNNCKFLWDTSNWGEIRIDKHRRIQERMQKVFFNITSSRLSYNDTLFTNFAKYDDKTKTVVKLCTSDTG